MPQQSNYMLLSICLLSFADKFFHRKSKKQLCNMKTEDKNKNESSCEKDEEMKRPEVSEKNKYLYPIEYGKMEHGFVDSQPKEKHKTKKKMIYLDGDIV